MSCNSTVAAAAEENSDIGYADADRARRRGKRSAGSDDDTDEDDNEVSDVEVVDRVLPCKPAMVKEEGGAKRFLPCKVREIGTAIV